MKETLGRKGADCHVRFALGQAEFVRMMSHKLGVAYSDYIKFLVAQEMERRGFVPSEEEHP